MEEIRMLEFLKQKEACKKSDMPRWIKDEMDYLSDLVIKRAEMVNGSLEGVSLYFPSDYKNYDLFLRFAKMFKSSFGVVNAKKNVYMIFNIGLGYSYVILDKTMKKSIEEANNRYEKKTKKK